MSGEFDLDQIYVIIREHFREEGHAPHYTEIAGELGVSPEEGRLALHALMDSPFPCWLHPDTDYIASFPPFSNIPTQYHITVGGVRKWFAQCGFEALAMRWLFPGERVLVEALCMNSGEPMRIELRDEEVLSAEPNTIYGYVAVPLAKWRANLPFP